VRRRAVVLAVIVAAFAVGGCRPAPVIRIGHAIHVTCQEDMPCWDCHTMGNRVCGPGRG
jgi:hypothetical protein